MTEIYMRDIIPENRTDAFMGKGTEALIKKAEAEDKEIIVGVFLKKPFIEE